VASGAAKCGILSAFYDECVLHLRRDNENVSVLKCAILARMNFTVLPS
jgi:hypothetical protein